MCESANREGASLIFKGCKGYPRSDSEDSQSRGRDRPHPIHAPQDEWRHAERERVFLKPLRVAVQDRVVYAELDLVRRSSRGRAGKRINVRLAPHTCVVPPGAAKPQISEFLAAWKMPPDARAALK